jgi:hypothetical protein
MEKEVAARMSPGRESPLGMPIAKENGWQLVVLAASIAVTYLKSN